MTEEEMNMGMGFWADLSTAPSTTLGMTLHEMTMGERMTE